MLMYILSGNRVGRLIVVAFAVLIAGCSTTKIPPSQSYSVTEQVPTAGQKVEPTKPGTAQLLPPENVALTAFIDLFNCWPQTKPHEGSTSKQKPNTTCGNTYDVLEDTELYTRLRISSEWHKKANLDGSKNDGIQFRNNQKRVWLSRYLVGKDTTRILSLKAAIAEHNYATTVPLLTFGHVSNRDVGENFDVLATESSIEGPYFRVGPSTKLSVSVEARTATQYSSNAVKTALAISKRVAEYTAPQSSLLTALTKDKASIGANAADDAIGRLTSEQEKEELRSEADISRWSPNYYIRINARLPDEQPDAPPLTGTWWVTLSTPRVSMFSNVEACERTKDSITCSKQTVKNAQANAVGSLFPSSVLDLPVGENVRLYEYIARQPWYSDTMVRIAKGGKDQGQAVREFCVNTVDTAYKLGLNRFDSLVALYAIVTTRLDDTVTTAVKANCADFKKQAANFGMNVWK